MLELYVVEEYKPSIGKRVKDVFDRLREQYLGKPQLGSQGPRHYFETGDVLDSIIPTVYLNQKAEYDNSKRKAKPTKDKSSWNPLEKAIYNTGKSIFGR